jgi:hypothetical protein
MASILAATESCVKAKPLVSGRFIVREMAGRLEKGGPTVRSLPLSTA